MLRIKRIYDEASSEDGVRILVDRVWPRGMSKSRAMIDHWMKDIAPSTELRKWFDHDPSRWREFKKRYFRELTEKQHPAEELMRMADGTTVTLLYSAKDEEHNQARALHEYLVCRSRG